MKIKVRIEEIASDGSGKGRHEGRAVLVPLVLPGEEAVVQVLESKREFLRGKALEIIGASPRRATPPCPHFGQCGGCSLQHLDAAGQAAFKEEILEKAFRRNAPGLERPPSSLIPSPVDRGFRNKMIFPAAPVKGRTVLGFYRFRSHALVPIERCLVACEEINARLPALKEIAAGLDPYLEERGTGLLRHVMVRAFGPGNSQVSFVLSREERPPIDLARLDAPGLWLNINPKPGNVILGPKWIPFAGERFLEIQLMGLVFKIHPGAFFQTHTPLLEDLLGLAERHVEPGLPLLDLYGGLGFFGLHLARKAPRVVVVEENPHAVLSGIESMRASFLDNVEFRELKAESALPAFAAFKPGDFQLLLDPPKAGLGAKVRALVLKHRPRKILYFSCNPVSFSRDLGFLAPPYRITSLYRIDLFPHTAHMELMGVLEREG